MKFMEKATELGYKAFSKEEIPIGAVIVKNNKIIAYAYNKREKSQIATHHAEILAIEKACKKLKSWRLDDCDLYVTLEPCPMCAGAILNARINKLYFGAYDKTSKTNLLEQIMQDDRLNHKTQVQGGIMEQDCSNIMTRFFKNKRQP